MEIKADAPAVARDHIVIAASIELVWEILVDIDNWPRWNADISSATIAGPLAQGTNFRWEAGPGTIASKIERADRPHLFGWTGRTFGISAVHVWRLEAEDGGTRVTTEESMEGFPVRLLGASIKKNVDKGLRNWLENLKAEAERRSR